MLSEDDIYSYNYILLQRDHFGDQLNSSQINDTLISRVSNNMILINIKSLILDITWSVSVEVSACQYNNMDITNYTNITNNIGNKKLFHLVILCVFS